MCKATHRCWYFIHLRPTEYLYSESKLWSIQRLAQLSLRYCVLHCLNSKISDKCRQHFWKCLFHFFLCTHSLLNKSTKMPLLYINTTSQSIHPKFQEARHRTENSAKNYRRKEQTTFCLFERSMVHNTGASQASRLMYKWMQNGILLPAVYTYVLEFS